MGVYIKGMEMPKRCTACPMFEGYSSMDGLCHAASKWLDDDEYWTWYVYPEGDIDDSKPCNCPLTELGRKQADVVERKYGHCLPKARYFYCSVCGYAVADVYEGAYDHDDEKVFVFEKGESWNYCPNCGADMREPPKEEA